MNEYDFDQKEETVMNYSQYPRLQQQGEEEEEGVGYLQLLSRTIYTVIKHVFINNEYVSMNF